MPKLQRNPFGTVLVTEAVKHGKKRTAFDARKRYLDSEGKPAQKFKRCWSRADANTALLNFHNEILAELEEAKNKKSEEHTFSELVQYYKKEYVKPAVIVNGRKVAGFKVNLVHLETMLDELDVFFGEMDIREITYENIRLYGERIAQVKTRTGNLPAIRTVNEKLAMLRRLLNIAIQMDWLTVSPFKRGKSLIDVASQTKRTRMLTFDEEARLLAACSGTKKIPYKRKKRLLPDGSVEDITATVKIRREHLIPIIICALDTAMRRAEIFNLEWWQIDLDKKIIYLTDAAAAGTKTGEPGILPISKRLLEIFEQRFKGQKKNEKVFKRFDYKKSFTSAVKDAGIEDLQFRDLRSTAATRLVLAGNPESQVMKITRHRNLKTFLDHYTNVDVTNAIRIGENLDRFMEEEQAKIKQKDKVTAKVDF